MNLESEIKLDFEIPNVFPIVLFKKRILQDNKIYQFVSSEMYSILLGATNQEIQ